MDLNKIPDEYVICASYDAELEELQKLKDAAEEEIHAAFEAASDDFDCRRRRCSSSSTTTCTAGTFD